MLNTQVIKYLCHHKIHQVLHTLWMIVKARIGRQDDRTGMTQLEHVFQMDGGKR